MATSHIPLSVNPSSVGQLNMLSKALPSITLVPKGFRFNNAFWSIWDWLNAFHDKFPCRSLLSEAATERLITTLDLFTLICLVSIFSRVAMLFSRRVTLLRYRKISANHKVHKECPYCKFKPIFHRWITVGAFLYIVTIIYPASDEV